MFRTQRIFVASVLIPVMLMVCIFGVFPILYVVWISFHKYSIFSGPNHPFIGLQNYADVLSDPTFQQAAMNSVFYPLLRLPIEFVVGLLFALAVSKIVRFRGLFLGMIFLPVATSLTAMSVFFTYVYAPHVGVLNTLLSAIGLPNQPFLNSPSQALSSIAAVDIWHGLGFPTVIFLAGLMGIGKEYYEAASIDGASRWQTFWFITFPLLRPTIAVVMIMDSIYLLQLFTPIFIMGGTQGGPMNSTLSVALLIFNEAFSNLRFGYAAAMAIVLFVVIFVVTTLWNRLGKIDM